MATSVNRQVNIYIASGEAEKAYDRLIAKEKSLTAELKKATNPADVKRLTAELKKLEEPIDRAAKKLKGEVAPSIRDLTTTLTKLQNQLKQKGIGEAEFNQLTLAVRKTKIELAEAYRRMEDIGSPKGIGKLAASTRSFLTGLGVGFGLEIFNQASQAVSAFFGGALEEALDAERTVNNLRQTLNASGQIEYFDKIIAKADEMAERFRFLDNDDVTGVFSSLINYGKLTENQMNQLIPVIVDFYSKQQLAGNTNFTLAESTSVVIKALEGNAKALKEYGINVKDGKNESERLNIVLDELGAKVKGAGDAFQNDLTGQVAVARTELNNLKEDLGNELIPVWDKVRIGFLKGVQGIIQGFKDIREGISNIFTDAEVLRERDQKNRTDKFYKEIEARAKSFANNEALKPIAEQRKSLDQQIALYKQAEKDVLKLQAFGQTYSKQGIQRTKDLLEYEATVKALQESIKTQTSKTVLGTGKGLSTDTGGKSDKDKAKEDLDRLIAELKRKTDELNLYNGNQLQKDLLRMNEFYDGMVTRANGNTQALAQIADLRGREENLIINKYRKQWEEEEKKAAQKTAEEKLKIERDRFAKLLSEQQRIAKLIADEGAKAGADQRTVTELRVLVSSGRAKLDAIRQQLKEQEQIELKAAEGKEQQIDLIYEKYRQKRMEAEVTFFQNQIESIASMVQNVVNQIDGVFQQLSQRENANLERDRQVNEQKKANLKRQLDGKVLSQTEYDKKVQAIEKQQEAREKQIRLRQFQRDKVIALTNAVINNALAFTKALAQGGPIYAAVVGALGLVQIGLIASQKAPKFARGGYLSGPSHREGGMPVINPRTGRKEAEVEGGEVILSRRTVRNNTALVEQLLHASMHRNGAAISPSWRNSSHSNLNIPVISSGMARVRMFEKGGLIAGATNAPATDQQVLEELAGAVNQLNSQLASGITAYTMISDNERQQARLDNIRNDATMR